MARGGTVHPIISMTCSAALTIPFASSHEGKLRSGQVNTYSKQQQGRGRWQANKKTVMASKTFTRLLSTSVLC